MVLDETDDYSVPVVTFESEVSDGMTCPETITRTYRVADSCNFIDVTQTIIVNDLDAPIMDPAPADVNVSCIADVPPIIGLNWTDNCLGSGTVMGVDVSDGQSCPETITRTWTISDDCGNITTEVQIITAHDLIVPDMDPAPADVFVQCYSNVPTMLPLNWSDNCDGNGQVNGVEVSDGNSCPEVLTRTWSYTDGCGNNVMRTQTVVIHDTTAPTASPLLAEQVITLPAPDITLLADASDNCGTPVVAFVGDSSNGGFCPEIVIRTYSVTDQCGNVTLITQNFAVGDPFPEASFIASPTLLTNLMEGTVNFTNTTTGAVTYEWDFDDGSATTNEISPTHDFYNDETAGYVVQLVATSPYGCTDTFTVVVQVREELLYFIPNSFTPDDDEFNQTFQPVFESGFDPYDFNMLIFNRWGEVVFETNDASSYGWDGTFNGYKVEAGTYIWRIEFGDEYTDERTIITGHVNLIR